MTERLPSLGLLATEVRAERELLFRQTDAVDRLRRALVGLGLGIGLLSAGTLASTIGG